MAEVNRVFVICVPTYNRGKKALQLVKDVLPSMQSEWELVVIDNCSTEECAQYEEIAKIADAYPGSLRYIRNASGVGFHGNYLNCLKFADRLPVMMISDEDRPGLPIIPEALRLLAERPAIGIVRGSIAPLADGGPRRNSFTLRKDMYSAGKQALMSYALTNNYFSGTIYNSKLLYDQGLVARLEKNLNIHRHYPHLYLECLASAIADVALCPEISCHEGAPQFVADGPADYAPPYSFGGRLDIFVVLRDSLYEAVQLMGSQFDAELFGNLYLRHVGKFFHLVGRANARLYAEHCLDVGVAVRSFAYFACAAIVRIKECEPYRDGIVAEIDRLAGQYGG